jgi:hypothetical protein
VTLRTIEQIDVLWLRGRAIKRAFEVEHTTSIYSGILRMADLLALQPNMDIRLHIVAPVARRDKVFQELRRPVFSLLDRGPLSESCSFLSYDSIRVGCPATPFASFRFGTCGIRRRCRGLGYWLTKAWSRRGDPRGSCPPCVPGLAQRSRGGSRRARSSRSRRRGAGPGRQRAVTSGGSPIHTCGATHRHRRGGVVPPGRVGTCPRRPPSAPGVCVIPPASTHGQLGG